MKELLILFITSLIISTLSLTKGFQEKCISGVVSSPHCWLENKDNPNKNIICSGRNAVVYVGFPTPFRHAPSSIIISLNHIDIATGTHMQNLLYGVNWENLTPNGFNARFYSARWAPPVWFLSAQWMACP